MRNIIKLLKTTIPAAMAITPMLSATSCRPAAMATDASNQPEVTDAVTVTQRDSRPVTPVPGTAVMPRAIAYRMSGDYAANIPVTLGPDGKLLSYPAPSDITTDATPIPLDGGWWLDRRGVNANTVFTRWTYAEYRAMQQPPSPDEIMQAIIPGARVTAVMRLEMTPAEAQADTAAVNAAISAATPRVRM